ncbi:hypothetical protein RFI_35369, partial [Reticulomyxa filosa]
KKKEEQSLQIKDTMKIEQHALNKKKEDANYQYDDDISTIGGDEDDLMTALRMSMAEGSPDIKKTNHAPLMDSDVEMTSTEQDITETNKGKEEEEEIEHSNGTDLALSHSKEDCDEILDVAVEHLIKMCTQRSTKQRSMVDHYGCYSLAVLQDIEPKVLSIAWHKYKSFATIMSLINSQCKELKVQDNLSNKNLTAIKQMQSRITTYFIIVAGFLDSNARERLKTLETVPSSQHS